MNSCTAYFLKRHHWLLPAVALLLGANNVAAMSWGGSLTAATEYVSKRGISLTDDKLALQPELHASASNGAYFGIWASNVDFDPVWGEIDLYAGIMWPVARKLKAGIGMFHYEELGDSSQNFQDYFVNAKYGNYFEIMYSYSPDFSGIDQQTGGLTEFISTLPITEKVSVRLYGGRMNFWGKANILKNFNIWQVSLRRISGKFDVRLNYSDTTSDQFLGRADRRVYLSLKYGW